MERERLPRERLGVDHLPSSFKVGTVVALRALTHEYGPHALTGLKGLVQLQPREKGKQRKYLIMAPCRTGISSPSS